ncbi:TIGR01244 family sulfur transferase [Salipiger sp. PrR002]|uniref:TIGR01244 family sulfur transferase n=1 Tax=Salipiger sp. PrR002 TaxID=2706489 RepID=UPI0013BAD294|nr:TIGR01244 family sulfur transferase [Salipiger sp. PrR002]NDW02160.1 TIGR01244 family phosphatase [Salipiger sp. PrR002]NDW59165.1 TIGR01244 family phosphatase [Salipiger sp. PrR004]
MDLNRITPRYTVSPQIAVEDVPALAEAGFKLVICNRPDAEVPPELQAETIGAAVTAAGMEFAVLPVTHDGLTLDLITQQAELIENADGPVFAYCRSGTRCATVWAMGQAGKQPADDILLATAKAGYSLDGLRPTLAAIAERGGA